MKRLFFLLMSLFSAHIFGQCEGSRWEAVPCWYERFEVGAEWLYWKADQSQLFIAVDVTSTSEPGFQNISSEILIPEFSYSNGYRVFASYDLDSSWSFYAALTHVPAEASFSLSVDPTTLDANFIGFNSVVFPILLPINSDGPFATGESQWDQNLYYLDFNLGKTFIPCHWFVISPYIGVRGYWLKEELFISGSGPAAGGASFTANLTEKLYGAGLQSGVYGTLQMRYGFSLVGQFGASLLYSHAKLNEDLFRSSVEGGSLLVGTNKLAHKTIPTVDSLVALQYSTSICNMFTELHIGWENHLFFNTNEFSIMADGNLSMQGLTLGGSIRF